MSVFTSRVTSVVPIEHDPPHTFTIRKLAPKHLHEAQASAQAQSIDEFRRVGGAAFLKELEVLGGPSVAQAAVQSNPLARYDKLVLVLRGVVAWSYDEPAALEAYEDLDAQTLDLIAESVLRLSRPDLYQTSEEQDAARKNG